MGRKLLKYIADVTFTYRFTCTSPKTRKLHYRIAICTTDHKFMDMTCIQDILTDILLQIDQRRQRTNSCCLVKGQQVKIHLENTVAKGEFAHNQQFQLLPQRLKKCLHGGTSLPWKLNREIIKSTNLRRFTEPFNVTNAI